MDLLRKEAVRARQPWRYDGRCRDLGQQELEDKVGQGHPFTVRFKLRPFPDVYDDLVVGKNTFDVHAQEGDPIIVKSDGFPTYHLANVVDDHHMRISHVLRGIEWHQSTTKHILLYEAFGWTPPKFAHLPLIMNPDGTKLSKRQGDVHVEAYREKGFFSEAVMNFATFVGGGFSDRDHRTDVTYSMSDFTKMFDLSKVSTHSAAIEFNRLDELNLTVLRNKLKDVGEREKLVPELRRLIDKTLEGESSSHLNDAYLMAMTEWAAKDRISKISDLVTGDLMFLWVMPTDLGSKHLLDVKVLVDILGLLEADDAPLKSEEVSSLLKAYGKKEKLKFPQLMKFLRIVFIASTEGPPVGEMMQVLGRSHSLARLRNGIKILDSYPGLKVYLYIHRCLQAYTNNLMHGVS